MKIETKNSYLNVIDQQKKVKRRSTVLLEKLAAEDTEKFRL